MDKITALIQRNPVSLARDIGRRMRRFRLATGWTQEELAKRAGHALSTLKLPESKNQISFLRLERVAVIGNVDGELRELLSRPLVMGSIEAIDRSERQRTPRGKSNKQTSNTI